MYKVITMVTLECLTERFINILKDYYARDYYHWRQSFCTNYELLRILMGGFQLAYTGLVIGNLFSEYGVLAEITAPDNQWYALQ